MQWGTEPPSDWSLCPDADDGQQTHPRRGDAPWSFRLPRHAAATISSDRVFAAALGASAVCGLVLIASASGDQSDHKVTLCHATDSTTAPPRERDRRLPQRAGGGPRKPRRSRVRSVRPGQVGRHHSVIRLRPRRPVRGHEPQQRRSEHPDERLLRHLHHHIAARGLTGLVAAPVGPPYKGLGRRRFLPTGSTKCCREARPSWGDWVFGQGCLCPGVRGYF